MNHSLQDLDFSKQVSFQNKLDFLADRKIAALYKDIFKMKSELIESIKVGNYTNDIIYFPAELKTYYHFKALELKQYLNSSIGMTTQEFENFIQSAKNFLDLKSIESRYSIKRTSRPELDSFNTYYLYVPLNNRNHQSGESITVFRKRKEANGRKILKKLALSQIQKRDNKRIRNKSFYLGSFDLTHYQNYAPTYFIYNPDAICYLLLLEEKVRNLIEIQYDEVVSQYRGVAYDDLTIFAKIESKYKQHQQDLTLYFEKLGEVMHLVQTKHQLIFKFLLANRYLEYVNGLDVALNITSQLKPTVTFSKEAHYQMESDLHTADEQKEAINDMKKTIKAFESLHFDYNESIKNYLKECKAFFQ